MKSKKILSMLILIITIIGLSTISNAALESKAGQTSWKASANDQFTNIRAMEKSGGTLGHNANLQATTYLDTTGNGIDVHMALATEWGGAALLAISDYGAFNIKGKAVDKGTKVAATTGNITGVFQMADDSAEYVAGLLKKESNPSTSHTSTMYSADSRYRNEYTTTVSEYHKGDAIFQTSGWYNGVSGYVDSTNPIFYRNRGIFGFEAGYGAYDWDYHHSHGFVRAVVVCGEGL